MPELPEVEYTRKLIASSVINSRITNVLATEDPIVFAGQSVDFIKDKLLNRKVDSVQRYGKYFWLVLDQGDCYLRMHLGMTGVVEVQGKTRLHYRAAPVENQKEKGKQKKSIVASSGPTWPPKYCKLQLEFSNEIKLAFSDARRLGRVIVMDNDPRKEPPIFANLTIDPLSDWIDFGEEFTSKIQNRAVPLKALLLDQSFVAGIGNWMADDILLYARLHPLTRSNQVTIDEAKRLHDAISHITRTAVETIDTSYPGNWLFHYRWPRDRKSVKVMEIDGNAIELIKVGGRTTAYIPALQLLSKK